MRSFVRALLVAACLSALAAAPAAAAVDDRVGALSPAQEASLDRRLAQLGGHRFDVVLVDEAPGGAVAMAERTFAARQLGADDGVILIDLGSRQVGVHLGAAFARAGVGPGTIQRLIAQAFAPAAREGDFGRAAGELASGLVRAEASAGVAGASRRARPAAAPAPGFPWLLVAVPAAAVAFYAWRQRRRRSGQRRASAGARIAALKAQQARILSGALKLDDASALVPYQSGTTARTYAALSARAAEVLDRAKALGERLDEAERQAPRGGPAEGDLDALEIEATLLESEVAAGMTGLDAMGDDPEESAAALALARQRLEAAAGRVPREQLAPLGAEWAAAARQRDGGDPTGALAAVQGLLVRLDALEGHAHPATAPIVVWSELPEQAEALARRLQEWEASYLNERERARAHGLAPEPAIEGRLQEARAALTTPPVDLAAAQGALASVEQEMARYQARIDQEAQGRPPLGGGEGPGGGPIGGVGPVMWGGWMPGPIIIHSTTLPEADRGAGLSGGGVWGEGGGEESWGGGWDAGSSGGGGWDGGSGGGSW